MKKCMLILLLLQACGSPKQAELKAGTGSVGQYKGYAQINRVLAGRLTENDPSFSMVAYVGGSAGIGLVQLLGKFSGSAGTNHFTNGDPNAMNILVLNMIVSGVAQDLAQLCNAPDAPAGNIGQPKTSLKVSIARICSWPSEDAKSREAMLSLWTGLMSFDAPISEFDAWHLFFTSQWRATDATESVATMIKTALLNPYFSLNR